MVKYRNESSLIACVACFSQIDHRAHVCPKCQSYQKCWKNNARYYASIVGLITFGLAAITYLADRAFEAYTWLTWKDEIELVSLESFETGVLQNIGDGRVTVTTMTMTVRELGHIAFVRVNREIESRQTVTIDIMKDSKQQYIGWSYMNKAGSI